ncbi:MAG: hypothetical protein AAFN27_05235 [Pseudomonadota bacterium]
MSKLNTEQRTELAPNEAFAGAAQTTAKRQRKRPAPLSVRVTATERAALEDAADGQSLNSYIRDQLFGASGKAVRSRRRRPVKDHVALAQTLGLLGQMDLGPSLRTLAEAAEAGALEVSPELEEELRGACAAVLAIHAELLRALGYKGESPE